MSGSTWVVAAVMNALRRVSVNARFSGDYAPRDLEKYAVQDFDYHQKLT